MIRIPKTAVNAALDQVGKQLVDAGGADKKVSPAELKSTLKTLEGTEKKLVDAFARFAQARSGSADRSLSESDVEGAVAYAKASLIAKYDLDDDGLSPEEIARMSRTGKLAVQLAAELLEAGPPTSDGPLATEGESWWELRERVQVSSSETITSADQMSGQLADQIIAACHQSTYTHVKTPADALAAVDQGEFAITLFSDPASGKQYVAIDYGAGDNTYGAIFEAGSTDVAFSIQDGEIYPPRSSDPHAPGTPTGTPIGIGESWYEVTERSEIVSREKVTDVTGLDAEVLGEQIVAAVQQSSLGPVSTVAEALAAVDAGGFVVTRFNDLATGQQFVGIDYGAGDSTYGAIFEASDSRPRFGIHDGELAAPKKRLGPPITTGGETFGDVLARVTIDAESTITRKSEVVDDLQGAQILVAARMGLLDPPQTLEQAFRGIDHGGFVVREFIDPATDTAYVAIDFGIGGGNTFGAIFESGSTEVAIAIIDGLMEE